MFKIAEVLIISQEQCKTKASAKLRIFVHLSCSSTKVLDKITIA